MSAHFAARALSVREIAAPETRDPVLARFVRDLAAQEPHAPDARKTHTPDAQISSSARFSAVDIAAARDAWAGRIVDEHRSVVVFSELLRLLAEVGAPLEALCAVQRLIGDEIRHASLCAEVCTWLGGADTLELDLSGLGLPPSDSPALERAYTIVMRELVVAERESVRVLAAYRDATSEPAIRAAFGILLTDEARHAATGDALARLLARLLGATRAPLDAALAPQLEHDRAYLRATYLAGATDGRGRALGASLTRQDLAATLLR